jgi:hypothetical protein
MMDIEAMFAFSFFMAKRVLTGLEVDTTGHGTTKHAECVLGAQACEYFKVNPSSPDAFIVFEVAEQAMDAYRRLERTRHDPIRGHIYKWAADRVGWFIDDNGLSGGELNAGLLHDWGKEHWLSPGSRLSAWTGMEDAFKRMHPSYWTVSEMKEGNSLPTNEEYAANNGIKCPYCGSDDTEYTGSSSGEGAVIGSECKCLSCLRHWTEWTTITGWSPIT